MKRRIVEVLSGNAPVGERVKIEGWVRTRRDSKAGLSFINVHDGSGFEAIQVVAPQELANYQTDVLRQGRKKPVSAGPAAGEEAEDRRVGCGRPRPQAFRRVPMVLVVTIVGLRDKR